MLRAVCGAVLLSFASSKAVPVTETLLQMDSRDRIVGKVHHTYFAEEEHLRSPKALPQIPTNTSGTLQSLFANQFPPGSLNMTCETGWVRPCSTCTSKDGNCVHHFEDTVYAGTQDICYLQEGVYTWTLTTDYQISFGRYRNVYEFDTKHANLAMGRPVYVAGELQIVKTNQEHKGGIFWNLLSGTFSIPISESVNPDKPMAYLEAVMYPKMKAVMDTITCDREIVYLGADELFRDLLPSVEAVQDLCESNDFVKAHNAIVWSGPPGQGESICKNWDKNTCAIRTKSKVE